MYQPAGQTLFKNKTCARALSRGVKFQGNKNASCALKEQRYSDALMTEVISLCGKKLRHVCF